MTSETAVMGRQKPGCEVVSNQNEVSLELP